MKTTLQSFVLFLRAAFLAAFLFTAARIAAAEQETALPDTWRFCNGAEFPGAAGSLARDGETMSLHYDFTGGGRYVAAYCDLETPRYLKALHFRLRKPAEGSITFRVTDATGQTLQKSLFYEGSHEQKITANMDGWQGYWGGSNDGVVKQPIHAFGILVESQGLENKTGAATFQLEGLDLLNEEEIAQAACAAPSPPLPYQVTDFGAGCLLAGSLGNQLQGKTWHIDFTQTSRAAMSGSLSLFHYPKALTFRARASAPGAALVFHIGSHFQNFTRTVGVFDGTEQVFTFTLPPEGWTASGAAHTTLHYPLRITGIAVERHECTADQVDITLQDITCETLTSGGATTIVLSRLHPLPPDNGERPFRLELTFWNLLAAPLNGTATVRIRNWEGDVIQETGIPVSLPGGGTALRMEHPFSVAESLRYVEADCACDVPGKQPARAVATYTTDFDSGSIAEHIPQPQPGLCPQSPWGMGVYLYRYGNTEPGLREMDRAAQLAAQAGVKWTREEFNYGMIEKAPGVYDFSFFDALVDTALRHGISIYALLAYWSPFIENPYSEEGIAAYCDYARAAVRRYKDRIKHWEIYNEPNIFFWEGPKDLYPELLRRVYAVIREEDPEARVLAISTSGIDREFIRKVVETGAPFDDLTVHPYRSQLTETTFIRELKFASKLADNRPVWITEMGWSTQIAGGKTEREQAQLLARAYLAGVGAGVRSMGWYNFRNDGTDPFYNEVNFGVLYQDLTPKAAYRALGTVCRCLAVTGDTQPGWLDNGDGKQGLYALATDRAATLWSPLEAMDITFAVERGQEPTVVNLMGEPAPCIRTEPFSTSTPLARGCLAAASAGRAPKTLAWQVSLRQGDPVFVLNEGVHILEVRASNTNNADERVIEF